MLVIILLLLFLGDIRAAIIVAYWLLMAALLTFTFIRTVGLAASLMSLGGCTIAIGIWVEDTLRVISYANIQQE